MEGTHEMEDLVFIERVQDYGAYGPIDSTHLRKADPHKGAEIIKKYRDRPTYDAVVTTELDRSLWNRLRKKVLHIAVLDLDGVQELMLAQHWIKEHIHTGYAVIESSPNRYWIVLDICTSIGEALQIIDDIPGVDPEYTKACKRDQLIVLRALPKTDLHLPRFIPEHTLKNRRVRGWYNAVRRYWESPELMTAVTKHRLKRKAAAGDLNDVLANPDFKV